ncbi:type II secretion system F family protein [Rhodobacteraceae bacterium HSP-20]|uniref:Type II secretion system F family protein n=1 Tax=Paragemmobacter amnigenus TaxID=2852097 RepID=A0ABS6J643_9RHOB|nr:type II secretion system F family protein [Rhodobacter amnigenus]MBU9699233.1 type II secretion system F family protein [Rhodobacter amnigenus]MBV4390460.1 type II secretion system F family protein [Rhodobacter amnigenus]
MLDTLNAMIVARLGEHGPLLLTGALGLVLIVVTLPILLKKEPEPFDKIKQPRQTADRAKDRPVPEGDLRRASDRNDKLNKFAHFLEPQDKEQMSAARLRMLRAGYRSKNAVRMFHAMQFLLAIGFMLAGVVYAFLVSRVQSLDMQAMALSVLLPAGAGYYLPTYWVQRRLAVRQQAITEGFPDALDMMLVCVEAGQSLDQSIARVAREIGSAYPDLAEEFDIVSQEVRAGKERVTVLRDMSERVGLPDITSFVTTMIQSATFGTSIAEALRVYSSEMRDKRVMRAEETANTLPTKLTLGTMLFTVPPLMIILIGPSIHGVMKAFGG